MSGADQSNIDTRGGDLVGVVVGGKQNRARGSKTTIQTYGPGSPVTVQQVMERLDELERAVEGSHMSNQLRQDTLSNVQTAREALGRETPAVVRARTTMEGTLEELGTGGRMEGLTAVVTLVTAIVEMLGALAG
jgi:hypothetical protein